MRKEGLIFLLALFVFFSGCTDIMDSAKAGAFGSSEEDQAILEYFISKYGDLTVNNNEPRIIEPLVTTNVTDFVPENIVSKFSKETNNLFAWFVYDDFSEGDKIEVKWVYEEDGTVIHTFSQETGPNFGRGSFSLGMPDEGWPIGRYSVVISGRGVSEKVDFEIIDGKTVSEPIPYLDELKQEIETGEEFEELYSNSNIYACGHTDTSEFSLEEEVFVSKIRVWYQWESNETELGFTLKKGDALVFEGVLEKDGCDPYQTSWCGASYYPNQKMSAGEYVLTTDNARVCQNSGTNGNGMYTIYGKKTGSKAQDPVVEVGSKTDSGFTVTELECDITGSWYSNWGDMEFKQEGSSVTATYTYRDGKIEGVMKGNILVGWWSEHPTYSAPDDAGAVELEFTDNCTELNGNWRFGETGEWDGGWEGTKK